MAWKQRESKATRHQAITHRGWVFWQQLSFYLQLLIYTIMILLSYLSVFLKQQPQREVSLAIIKNFQLFFAVSKTSKMQCTISHCDFLYLTSKGFFHITILLGTIMLHRLLYRQRILMFVVTQFVLLSKLICYHRNFFLLSKPVLFGWVFSLFSRIWCGQIITLYT